ncbi:MAG: sigma-70 family RNA polymerase sigma factor [Chitinophagales bacterium]|jgi:RNA polymerase sigma factor (sigma-70 family)|nr:sigma-70 family RNA polymerase sigma factor [Saprospirales bacterium]MBP6659201.1 sigma-70 family RNA polymerase sigma factor [Chitinophagales bacterium]
MEIKSHNTIDNDLISDAKNGRQKAFASLMQKYQKSVYHVILKIVKNKEDAEDLTIETFAKAFDNLEQYSEKFAFSTWLFKIASNTSIDMLRKKRIEQVSLESESKQISDNIKFSTKSTPETEMITAQQKTQLKNVVHSMDEIFSRVIDLRYFKELSYEEISEELNIPIGTIKVQLYRAKKLLMEKFLTDTNYKTK